MCELISFTVLLYSNYVMLPDYAQCIIHLSKSRSFIRVCLVETWEAVECIRMNTNARHNLFDSPIDSTINP